MGGAATYKGGSCRWSSRGALRRGGEGQLPPRLTMFFPCIFPPHYKYVTAKWQNFRVGKSKSGGDIPGSPTLCIKPCTYIRNVLYSEVGYQTGTKLCSCTSQSAETSYKVEDVFKKLLQTVGTLWHNTCKKYMRVCYISAYDKILSLFRHNVRPCQI